MQTEAKLRIGSARFFSREIRFYNAVQSSAKSLGVAMLLTPGRIAKKRVHTGGRVVAAGRVVIERLLSPAAVL